LILPFGFAMQQVRIPPRGLSNWRVDMAGVNLSVVLSPRGGWPCPDCSDDIRPFNENNPTEAQSRCLQK
jgi:hypothetical protein